MLRNHDTEVLLAFGEWLICPVCGQDYLHHEAIEWWSRDQEDGSSRVEVLGAVRYGLHSDASANPSRRRDGLRIRFWCENECAVPPLDLVQHKGRTSLCWGEAATAAVIMRRAAS